MTINGPHDWEFLCPISATRVGETKPAPVVLNAGALRSPYWFGPHIALQIDNRTVILPPQSAARLIGALQRGLREVPMVGRD